LRGEKLLRRELDRKREERDMKVGRLFKGERTLRE